MKLGLIVAALIFCLDQITKHLMLGILFDPPRQIVLSSFMNLTPVMNRGISFGLFPAESSGALAFLILLSLLVILVLIWWLKSLKHWESCYALGLVIGGALGNLLDRIRFSGVVDFFDFHYAQFHWPTFNVADVAITLGVAILILGHFTIQEEKAKTEV